MIWGEFKQELEWCQQVGRIGSPQPFTAWSRFNSKQTPMPLQEIRNELWCPSTQGIMKPITWQPKRKWVITRYSPSLTAWCGGVFNCHHLPGRRRSSYVQNCLRQAAVLTGFGVVPIQALNRTWSQVGGLWDQDYQHAQKLVFNNRQISQFKNRQWTLTGNSPTMFSWTLDTWKYV